MTRRTPPKLRWVEVAERVLAASPEPLHSKEIVRIALKQRLVRTVGETPDHSIQAAVWKNLRDLGERSPFVMIGEGRVKRKYWLRSKLQGPQGEG
jgi:HB1, ASXL, restriction endonuclease HTH domain